MDASMAHYEAIVAADNHIQDEGRLKGLSYLEVLEAMRRGVLLSAHKARQGVLVEQPEDLFT